MILFIWNIPRNDQCNSRLLLVKFNYLSMIDSCSSQDYVVLQHKISCCAGRWRAQILEYKESRFCFFLARPLDLSVPD